MNENMIEKYLTIIMQKLGITKDGHLTGNSIISKIRDIDYEIKGIDKKSGRLTEIKNNTYFEIKEIKNSISLIKNDFSERYEKIEKYICEISKNILGIHSSIIDTQSKMKSDVISKDYIFTVMKNIIIIAGFITAMGAIDFFILKAFS